MQRTTHLVGAYLNARLADLGITQGEAHVLAVLAAGTSVRVGEIQRELGVSASTVTSLLDRLEHDGAVMREPNPRDRRSYSVRLTAQGRRAAQRAVRAMADRGSEAVARVSQRDLDGFRVVLAALGGERGPGPSAT